MIITTVPHRALHAFVAGVVQPDPAGYGGPGSTILTWLMDGAVLFALAACLLGVVAGGAMLAIGHFAKHGEAQSRGLKLLIGAVIGAAIIGSAAKIINATSILGF